MSKLYKEIDKSILVALPNPTTEAYEIKIKIPEFTFLGVQEQPDFAAIYITFYPKNKKIFYNYHCKYNKSYVCTCIMMHR